MTEGKTKTRAIHRQTEPHFVLMVILIFSDLSTFCYARRAENAKVVKRIHQGQERFNQRVSGPCFYAITCYDKLSMKTSYVQQANAATGGLMIVGVAKIIQDHCQGMCDICIICILH